jgi:arylsulfatase A-like enzyme
MLTTEVSMHVGKWSLLATLLAAAAAPAVEPAPRKPNVVIILADDLGYGDLGCYGHPKFKTPHLDQLAKDGARLTQFNTPMPFCAPTRASLMTGRYPSRCGLTSNPAPDGGPKSDALGLPLDEVLLPQMLKEQGYATAIVGKWHLGHSKPDFMPTQRGFDEYLGIPYSNDMRPVRLVDGVKPVEYPVVQATITKRYTDRSLEFIEKNKDKPFFLYLAHAMPHKPLAVSEDYYKKSKVGLYADVMAELDASVGQVLSKLNDLKLAENTLVIFSSDNGPWFGGSTGGLRGMKATTWEGGYRVPCIVRWTGRVPAGRTNTQLAIMMDLFATALAAAGAPAPKDRDIDGRDLLPMLIDKKAGPHETILGYQGAKLATIRDARWKLHVLPAVDRKEKLTGGRWVDPRGPDGVTILAPYEQAQPDEYPGLRGGDETKAMTLFDLANDPGEQKDVAGQNADVVVRLKAQFDAAAKELMPPKEKKR